MPICAYLRAPVPVVRHRRLRDTGASVRRRGSARAWAREPAICASVVGCRPVAETCRRVALRIVPDSPYPDRRKQPLCSADHRESNALPPLADATSPLKRAKQDQGPFLPSARRSPWVGSGWYSLQPSLLPLSGSWSGRRDSNPRPSPWQGDALPAEPRPQAVANLSRPTPDHQPLTRQGGGVRRTPGGDSAPPGRAGRGPSRRPGIPGRRGCRAGPGRP